MAKKSAQIKFKQDLICAVDLEHLVNSVLDWANEIYCCLFNGRKTDKIQGKHLSSFAILTSIGRRLDDMGIALDLCEKTQSAPKENECENQAEQNEQIKQGDIGVKPRKKEASKPKIIDCKKAQPATDSAALDFSQAKIGQKRAVIKQEFVYSANLADLIAGLLTDMAKKTAIADKIAGKWLPDEFTMGEIEACNEVVALMEKALTDCKLKPCNLRKIYNNLIADYEN